MFWSKKSHFKVSTMVLVCAMLMQLSSGLFVPAVAMPFYDTGSAESVVDTGNGDSGNIDDEMSMRDSGVVLSLRAGEDVKMPAGFITSVEVGQKLEGSTVLPFDEKKPVARDASFGIKYTYTIPPKDSGEIFPNIGYWFEIPDHMALPNGKEINFKISESGVGEIARGIVSDGRVTITFNELALTKELLKPGVDGSFWFDMSFNKSVIENNGDKEFTDWGNGTNSPVTVPFKVDQVTAEVGIVKSTTGADITSTDNNLYTIPWVMTLTPKMENIKTGDNKFSKWVVTDEIPDHLTYVTGTGSIVDKAGVTVPNATITYEDSNRTLTCTFPTSPNGFVIDNGSVYTLSFRTRFNPAIVADSGISPGGKHTFTNTATTEYAYPQYEKDTTPESDTKGQAIKIADEAGTNKSDVATAEITGGSLNKSGLLTEMKPEAKIKWTINVTNAVNLANPTIKDILPKKATLVQGSLEVNGTKINSAAEGATTPNTYKLDGRELTIYLAGGTAAQTITYETTLRGLDAADVNIINNAKFLAGTGPNLGVIFEKSATVPLNDQLMTKGGTYNPADHTIDWTIQVSSAGSSLKNVVLTDEIKAGQEFVAGSLKAEPAAQSAVYDSGTRTIIVTYDNEPSVGGKEKVTYKTKLTNKEKHLWGNNVTTVDNKNANNEVTLTATDMISLTVTGNAPITSEVLRKEYKGYDFATHKAKWQVTVNKNKMAITNPVVIDEITTAGCAFVEDEIAVTQDGVDVTAKLKDKSFANNTTSSVQGVNPKMTLTLANMQQGAEPYVITYYTVFAAEELQTNAKVPIENKVILTGNEIYDKLNPITVKAEVGSNVLDKTGTNTKDGYIRWDVIINENLVPITASDGAELKLIDKLEEGLALDLSSVVMKEYNYTSIVGADGVMAGTWAEGETLTQKTDYTINYNNKTRDFEIIFPTNKITTAYKLSFRTDVITGTKHSNTISFKSITGSNPGGSETEIDLSTGGGITETKRGHIEITKKDSDGITLLTGAEFTLSKDDRDIAVMAVDENGVLEFKDVRVGTYYLTETKAPYGYLLPNAPNNRTEIVVKDKETTIKTITNTRITNDLTITKTDDKTNATALNGAEFTVMRTGGGENDNITFADVIITSGKTTTLKTVAGTGTNGAAVGKFITTVVGEPASGTKGEAKITGLPVGTYTVTEKTAPSGYVLDATPQTFTVTNAGVTHAYTFTNTQILGSLKLTKTDGKTPATLLAGAEFTVKRVGEIDDNTNNNITFADATITTDEKGEVILNGLPVGSYTVTETKAPNGYVLNSAPKNFEIVGNGTARAEQKTLTVTNEKIEGTILVTKTDAADPAKKLQGAEFTATKTDAPNKDDKFSAITDANGVATFKLAAGNYTVVETKAPSGYVLNATPQNVTIVDRETQQPEQVTLSFTNTQILGNLELTKTDELGKLLAGAEFSVTKAGTPAFTATITTDVNGKTTLASLPVGTYTVTETKAPNGYVLDAEPQIFTIDDNGTQQTAPKQLTFKNTWAKGKLQISKTDTATGAALAGAEFTIVKIDGGYSQEATTGADGKAVVTMLMRGDYEVTEVKAPKGYQIDTAKQTIAVSDTAPEVKLTFTNTFILGSLELTKTDDKTPAKPLEGAKFELYNTEGDALVAEGTTDKDGKLRFDNLTAGNYYYKEKQAPVGYVKDETKRAFSITVNGQVVAETFTNKAVPPSNNGGGNNTPSVSPPPEVVIVLPPTVPQSPLPGTPPNTTPQISSGTIPTTPTGTPEVKVQPANGTVIIDKDGKWVYTPKAGFVGDDEFTATVTYPSGYTETFVIKLSVLSGYVPFLPETGEAPRTMFYVGGLLLIMIGIVIKRKLKKI